MQPNLTALEKEAVQPVRVDYKIPKKEAPQYYTTLNGLRAVAVILVLFHHFFDQDIAVKLRLGSLGVDIFFVLSGFLITNILLSYKENLSFKQSLKKFYTRRALRIFPLYYFYIGIVFLLLHASINTTGLAWASFFAVNIYGVLGGSPDLVYGHFWSLAVEEQFYFVWPFFILLTPYRYMKPVILGSMVISFLYSTISGVIFDLRLSPWLHPISCVMALGAGGLLSILMKEKSKYLNPVRKYSNQLIALSCVFIVLAMLINMKYNLFSVFRASGTLLSFVLILRLTQKANQSDGFQTAMKLPFLQFIGKISFGVYVYHVLVQHLLEPVLLNSVFKAGAGDTGFLLYIKNHPYWITMFLYSGLAIGISYLSFRFLETPFNKLKERSG